MSDQKPVRKILSDFPNLSGIGIIEGVIGLTSFHGKEENEWWANRGILDVNYIEALREGRLPITHEVARQLLEVFEPSIVDEDTVQMLVDLDARVAKLRERLQQLSAR